MRAFWQLYPPPTTLPNREGGCARAGMQDLERARVLQATSNQGNQGFGQSPSAGTFC